jgi:radical SAM superfamily enzyme YgiQ (UPF0313 family)
VYGKEKIPAYDMRSVSVNITRGCFMAVPSTDYRARRLIIQNCSQKPIIREIEEIRDKVRAGQLSYFRSRWADRTCTAPPARERNELRAASHPATGICPNLNTDHSALDPSLASVALAPRQA